MKVAGGRFTTNNVVFSAHELVVKTQTTEPPEELRIPAMHPHPPPAFPSGSGLSISSALNFPFN